jgi:hypothetical protein
MRKLDRTIEAKDPSGRKHKLKVYATYRQPTSLTGPTNVVKGMEEFETEDGRQVIARGNGEYEIVSTGLKLHSDDPNAP